MNNEELEKKIVLLENQIKSLTKIVITDRITMLYNSQFCPYHLISVRGPENYEHDQSVCCELCGKPIQKHESVYFGMCVNLVDQANLENYYQSVIFHTKCVSEQYLETMKYSSFEIKSIIGHH
jgi:hypothetical protein